jgi:hypothetical protein
MSKYFILLLVIVSLSAPFGFSSRANKNQSASFTPTPTPKPTPLAEIERIELDKNEIFYICPPSDSGGRDEDFRIKVKTIVRNPKNFPLIYQYTVSGGQIIGQGEKVVWDLNNVRLGNYTITVGIGYDRGFFTETKSEKITVKECPICIILPCVCPTTFSVTGKEKVRASESLIFTANVSGGTATSITYNWTVSQGEIVDGQGTSQIKVKTTREMTGVIQATVEIGGIGLCETCTRIESATVEINK